MQAKMKNTLSVAGRLIHQAIGRAWQTNSADTWDSFDVWLEYRERVSQGQAAGAVTFLREAEQYLPVSLYDKL